ncbi:retrotransposon hot spot (RHS) protein, putative [Trypanosoma cruzi]|nr:retrotransposon hot spot (RHS) protein, putative [Trypanosoma cruzi]
MPGNQASAVPQGDRRGRARPEFEGDTDQPAATHIRVAETRRPQWTMSSYIKDILLERNTNRNNMKLSDFIRSYLGDTAAVDEDSNVTMQVLVQEPDAYVQDQRLLELIFNLTEYQALEAITKPLHEGVLSLEQWRDYEGKDTITPLARGNLNSVLTQLLREESREAEERLIREEEESTLTATIRGVLFKGRVRVKDIKLNDFLTLRFGGKGIVATNWDVLLEEFFKDPARYIHDAGILNEIKTTVAYLRAERAVREEMDMEEAARRLHEKGAKNLIGWSRATEKVKAGVYDNTKKSLDAALEGARILTMSAI